MSKKIFLILILSFFFLVTCENENQNENIQTQFDLEKMKIKELRRLLEERGVDCIGCSEKAHLIEKVRESLHLPILSNDEKEKEINEQTKSEDKEPPKTLSQMELKEILKNLENEKNKKRELRERLRQQGVNILEEDNQEEQIERFLKQYKHKKDEL